MMALSHPALLRNQAFINGRWADARHGSTFAVTNPATGQLIGNAPDMDAGDARLAVEAAQAAGTSWKALTAAERAARLRTWYDLQLQHLEDLALLLTMEQGKPLAEARSEVRYGASFVEWFAEEAKRAYGEVIPGHGTDKRIVTLRQPVGVVAAITPWNFLNAMITRKVAP
ncbi:MAG: aldehyde dehydrogenase family protein, partial [Bacteroidota bacterium]